MAQLHYRILINPNYDGFARYHMVRGAKDFNCSLLSTYRLVVSVVIVFSERTTLRSLYAISRPSVVCLSVCDVGAPYSGG